MTQEEFEGDLKDFLGEWRDNTLTVRVRTSGSTGTPKTLQVSKERMRASARMTCDFLGLVAGNSALLCMSLDHIAGKMVVVRALERGLDLLPVAPCGHPFSGLASSPDFAALVPLQVYNSLEVPRERTLLEGVGSLIIGGGPIDPAMAETLRGFPNGVWSSYGMTETLSHIALRRLSGPDASEWYDPLPGVGLSLSSSSTLVIDAPAVCAERLETRDVAELRADGRFKVKGRVDNVVNSGGIKIQIEEVEALLSGFLDIPFQITAVPDPKFGEALVLLYEGAGEESVRMLCRKNLPPYWIPRRYRAVDRLPVTRNGKPDRAGARRLALE